MRSAVKDGRTRDNLLWRAIADAPEGYCHPRASVTGALLEDIAAGLAFNDIKARFDAKMHPLMYQRPQAAPSAGNIAHAESWWKTLGIAPSLERRFARLEDCETLWTPRAPKAAPVAVGGVFAHLSPKADAMPSVDLPRKTMTWAKFVSSVMPDAEAMEMLVPAAGNFIALTAAANADAPPILKWDREDRRNTVAWYVYHGGSPASQWGLTSNRWHPLTAVVDAPPMWGDRPMPHLAVGPALIIQGAADMRTGQGNTLFPENLRQELHAARSTIEAYSRRAEMQGTRGSVSLRIWHQQRVYRLLVACNSGRPQGRISYRALGLSYGSPRFGGVISFRGQNRQPPQPPNRTSRTITNSTSPSPPPK